MDTAQNKEISNGTNAFLFVKVKMKDFCPVSLRVHVQRCEHGADTFFRDQRKSLDVC
jgi:hypothetical protein